MASRVIHRVRPALIAATLVLALASVSAPARAHHGADYIAPLAAFIAFGALAHHSHHHHYRHRYYGHGHRPHYRPYRRHSHSHGGYYKPHHKRHRNW